MGGVKVNTWGETNIGGLFAIGETACTGVHGANRLASNSLLEVIVFSKRIMEKTNITDNIQPSPVNTNDAYQVLSHRNVITNIPQLNLSNLQSMLWDKVGIIRSGESLTEAADILYTWQNLLPQPTDQASHELSNMVLNARLMTEAALLREESRGAHFRTDFPEPSTAWKKHIIFKVDEQP
jgi:L-aspartate oxidase